MAAAASPTTRLMDCRRVIILVFRDDGIRQFSTAADVALVKGASKS